MSEKSNIRTIGAVEAGSVPVYDYFDNGAVFIRESGTVIEDGIVISTDTHDDVKENLLAYVDNEISITDDGALILDLNLGVSFRFIHNRDIEQIIIEGAIPDGFALPISITRIKDSSAEEKNINWGENFLFPNGIFGGLTQAPDAIDEIVLMRIEDSKWIVSIKRNFS